MQSTQPAIHKNYLKIADIMMRYLIDHFFESNLFLRQHSDKKRIASVSARNNVYEFKRFEVI